MKKTYQWMVSGVVATVALVSVALAGGQNFNNSASNSGVNYYYDLDVPVTCSISSTASLNNPIQPLGGGGAGISITYVPTSTIVYSFGYSGYLSGSASRSASSQPAGQYHIVHYVTGGGAGVVGSASTSFTW